MVIANALYYTQTRIFINPPAYARFSTIATSRGTMANGE